MKYVDILLENGHLDTDQEIMYAEHLQQDTLHLLPTATVAHVADCLQCRVEILEMYATLKKKPPFDIDRFLRKILLLTHLQEAIFTVLKQEETTALLENRLATARSTRSDLSFGLKKPAPDRLLYFDSRDLVFEFERTPNSFIHLSIFNAQDEEIFYKKLPKNQLRYTLPSSIPFPTGQYAYQLTVGPDFYAEKFYVCTPENARRILGK